MVNGQRVNVEIIQKSSFKKLKKKRKQKYSYDNFAFTYIQEKQISQYINYNKNWQVLYYLYA